MRILRQFVIPITLWLTLASLQQAQAGDIWKAGVAKVNITPEQYMWMSGYGGRDKPAEGKRTDLWTKSLVLQDEEGQRVVLITLDLVGVDRALSTAVCKQLKERYDLDRNQVAICTSHTHTGPALRRNLAPLHYLVVDARQQRLIDEYTDQLQANIVAVVGQSLAQLSPAKLSWGSGRATFAVNRRENRPESEVPKRRLEDQLRGPIDHDVPVLAVRNLEGQLKTVVFGYACHATVLSFYEWSGDYPGFAQMEFEKHHPGCTAMYWAGCGADQNPLPRRTVELAQHYGRRLATAVESVVLTSQMKPVKSQVRAVYREVDLQLARLPTRAEIEQDTKSENRFVAARAKMLSDQLAKTGELDQTYPFPVASWQLGEDIQFVILGGEVVVDYPIRLKAELRGVNTWVAAYANDVMAYIPSRRVLTEGGYEGGGAMVYYGLPTAWHPDVEKTIVDEVHRQLATQ